jgi:nicotinamidase-related amidase
MSQASELPPRSPDLMSIGDTGLLVVDVQEKLIGHIVNHKRLVWNACRLVDGAKLLELPVAASEQYPKGLGPTVAELAGRLGHIPSKLTFSCGANLPQLAAWREQGVFRVLVCGIESHVCVQQTVLDLMAEGFRIYLAVDAVGSRQPLDHEIALRRMESGGATLTTTESALFEWCQTAGHPRFKEMSALVKQSPPA